MNPETQLQHEEKSKVKTDQSDSFTDIPNKMAPDERINLARPENPFCAVEIE